MTIIAAPAVSGAQGFDTDSVLDAATAITLRQTGLVFGARYLSLGTPNNVGDLTAGEVQIILAAGLMLLAVQHCRAAYWTPTASLGTQYGLAAAANAAAVGYPAGATIALDLENMRPGCGAVAIAAYVNAWYAAVTAAGFSAMLYFTADCPLTPPQLYDDLLVSLYWRGLSADAPSVATRGVCVQQSLQSGQVAGIDIDRDMITADALGGLPLWATLAA